MNGKPEHITTAPQAVIFDLDGVLMNSEWLTFLVWREWAARLGGFLPDAAFHEMLGTSAEESGAIVRRHTGLQFEIADGTGWVWPRVTERLREEANPLPGSRELVQRLAGRGIPLAIASNSITSYIESALLGLGLLEYFPLRASVDQVPQGKPAPDVYLRAAHLLGISPRHCLAVEDSRVGVQAAVAAGMRVIAVPGELDHQDGFHSAWRVYKSMWQVIDQLDEILA